MPPSDDRVRRIAVRPARLLAAALAGLLLALGVAALLVSIGERRGEARDPYALVLPVDEDTTDPAVWGASFPSQYESYLRTTDAERTRYGGSDAIPHQKLDEDPWLRAMWSGYAFSLDYRESRGHAYTLIDQEESPRVQARPQTGACLLCHASIGPLYRYVGDGDETAGFVEVSGMPWEEARFLTDDAGRPLVEHPVSCVDCHTPGTMALRVTRPAFEAGIRALEASRGNPDYDVERDASHQQMRTYVCAQCHVEYYFDPERNGAVTHPWSEGLRADEIESHYDQIGFNDWRHGTTGGEMRKAQHPEFELWSQGTHAAAGVACADCHMPYEREGAYKVSSHHVRSPLLDVNAACQTCHNVPEDELLRRANDIQDRTDALVDRAAAALVDLITAVAAARRLGSTDADLDRAVRLQRQAQWRLDFVYSEGSTGFHAPQEAARLLAEAIDQARQGELQVVAIHGDRLDREAVEIMPVEGVTPDPLAPADP